MAQTIADLVVNCLADVGVKRIWGVTGDSLNGLNDSLVRLKKLDWMPVRHEETGAFAAGGEAAATGRLAVCAGSCGPGNLHLINGLYDCQRNRVPVLAIAAHIPSSEIGLGYFQETHPEILFRECSEFVELVSNPAQMPSILYRAINTAIGRQGVAVLVVPGNLFASEAPEVPEHFWSLPKPTRNLPDPADVDKLAEYLSQPGDTTIFAGRGCAGYHDQVVELADTLKAPIVHALKGKEHLEWDNPFDVGMTGLIGVRSGYDTLMRAKKVLMLGTDFPFRAFYPKDATILQVDRDPANLGRRAPLTMGIAADVGETLQALLPKLNKASDRRFLDEALSSYEKARNELTEEAVAAEPGEQVHPQYLTQLVSELADDDAIFTADVGSPTVWAARFLKMNGKRRLIGSFNHGSMANAMLQAIGAQAAFPDRQVISLSGDGGFTMMMGDFLTLLQLKIPVKVIVSNNASLGFVAMEMQAAGFPDTGTDLVNPNFAAMAQAAGATAFRVDDSANLKEVLEKALSHPGPVLVDVRTQKQEPVLLKI